VNLDKSNAPVPAAALGFDIGATSIKAGIVSSDGKMLESWHQPSPRSRETLRDFIHACLNKTKAPIKGVGVGCRGIIDPRTSRINDIPGVLQFLKGTLLTELIGVDGLLVRVDNDARTALLAEVLWGAARGRRNVVLLTLGTGVGGAAMVDGVILHGAAGIAGHFGHMTVDIGGGLCICGNRGCLETRFSSRAIEADYFAHMHRAAKHRLALGKDGQTPDTEAIFRAAANGDESAICVLDRAIESLTAAVVSLLHIFDPEVLIVGGNIVTAGEQLLDPLRTGVSKYSRRMLSREVPIVAQTQIGYGGVLGAAGLVFLEHGLLKI
jgi:glucokinase